MEDNESVPRITYRKIGSDILAELELKRGLLFTLAELFRRPGSAVRDFLFTARRTKFVKPITFLLLTTAAAAFTSSYLLDYDLMTRDFREGFSLGYESIEGKTPDPEITQRRMEAYVAALNQLFTQYFNILVMLSLPFYSLFTFLLFKRERMNYPEHLVANMYVLGVQNLLFIPLVGFMTDFPVLYYVYLLLALGYQLWLYSGLFTTYRLAGKLWRGGMATILGMTTYMLVFAMALIFYLIIWS